MSAMEKNVLQIFEKTKRIVEQSRQQCHLWEHHLFPKLLLQGITPPPWLCNSSLHSRPSDPQELNKDNIVSEVLLSQPQFSVPFPGHHCSLYSNLDVVSDAGKCPTRLCDEGCALKKDCNIIDGLSSLPDCSVNDVGCASSGPPELDSGAMSPQNQLEPRDPDGHQDPSLSLAKLQRSKSRQRALELRNSAKAPKRWSGDDSNAGVCADMVTGSASSTLQEEHIMESVLVKDLHSSIQSCSMEELARPDRVTEKEKSNYSGRITRSRRSSQKNSLNIASSYVEKEGGPPPYNLNKSLEIVNQPIEESCGFKEANKGEYQSKEAGRSVYNKRLTKSRSSSQARYNGETLKLDSALGSGKGVEMCDLMHPFTQASQASDCENGSRRKTVKEGDSYHTKHESNIHNRISLLSSSSPLPGDDFLIPGGSVKSINKSAQSPPLLISQGPAVSGVGSFNCQKDAKTNECVSGSGPSKAYHAKEALKSSRSNSCVQNATCPESVVNKTQNLWPTEMDAKRSSSSPKFSNLDIEFATNSTEKENDSILATSRNTRAVTTCTNQGSLKPVGSSNSDCPSLLAEPTLIETDVGEKVLSTIENVLSGVIPTDIVQPRSAATLGKVDADFDGLVEKVPCSSPKVGLNVSVLKLPPDFAMSVMPKQLDFDDVEENNMNVIGSPDFKESQQGMTPETETLNSLEPVNLLEEETSPVCQDKQNSSGEMHLLEPQEVLIRQEEPRMENCASLFEEENTAGTALHAKSPTLMNHSSPSQVADKSLSESLSEEVMASEFVSVNVKPKNDESSTSLADSSSKTVAGNVLHKYKDENVTNFAVGLPFAAPMDDVNVNLVQWAQDSISPCQNIDLYGEALHNDGKVAGFPTDIQIFRSSTESFTYDVESSCPHQKRRKVDIETLKFLPASSNHLENPVDSIEQRPVVRKLNIEEGNCEVPQEVQHLPANQEHDTWHKCVSNNPTDEMQYNEECQTLQGSSLKLRGEEKLILDGRGRTADTLLLAEANPSGLSIDSIMKSTVVEKVESWRHQVSCGQESAELLSCVERSTSSGRIDPGGNAELSDSTSVSSGIQCLDLIGTDEALPEFEGFIVQTDDVQPCIDGDQMELEKMSLLSNSIDYTSHGKSRFLQSPLCYSSAPYKLHNLPKLYESVPNGILEGFGQRTSLPLIGGSPMSISDGQPNCKAQYISSVQTLWERINSNFGSSGKRKSLKLELPCITEENENVDETAGTREPLAEIIDNENPSTSVLQDDMLTGGQSNLSGTCSKVKDKVNKQDGKRKRFTSKGKENQNVSLGANGVKRTTESVHKRPSRLKLSGKGSMKQAAVCNNIVSNVSSFIPLVQQKQAAAAFTGKRDIKVKALEAAEAAKRMAEKKENERKMKKEAMRHEREKLEQQNLRQLELQKKMKQEERKKKEAQMAAKKRQREDEEKKEKERKKKRVNETKKQLQEYEKINAKKEEIVSKSQDPGEKIQENKKNMDERENHNNVQLQDKREGNVEKNAVIEPLAIRDLANDKRKESCPEYSEDVNDCANNGKVMGNFIGVNEDDDLIIKNSLQEQSYEISPYKGSDDEDEDEDDMPNNKFIPSWASKHSLSLIVASQKMNPEILFPPQSFCNITEVLLPRKLQLQ